MYCCVCLCVCVVAGVVKVSVTHMHITVCVCCRITIDMFVACPWECKCRACVYICTGSPEPHCISIDLR